MFEHLDDPLQRERDLIAEYGTVALLSAAVRRRRGVIVTTLALALVATGGVSGLALGGPDAVHAPIDGGQYLALGDPRSTPDGLPPLSLTGSDRTLPGTCPSAADAGHPASSAAVAVAVTDAVVVGAVNGGPALTGGGAPSPTATMFAIASGATSHGGTGVAAPTPSGGAPHPVVVPPSSPKPPPVTSPGGNTGGGSTDPGPVVTPPVDTGGGSSDPGGSTGGGVVDPGGDTGSGGDTGGGGSTESPSPEPTLPDVTLLDLLPLP